MRSFTDNNKEIPVIPHLKGWPEFYFSNSYTDGTLRYHVTGSKAGWFLSLSITWVVRETSGQIRIRLKVFHLVYIPFTSPPPFFFS